MADKDLQALTEQEYKYGFVSDIETESIPAGVNEDIVRLISRKKGEPEFMLEWRLRAFRHWLTMKEPTWHKPHHPAIDDQKILYYSAPKPKKELKVFAFVHFESICRLILWPRQGH